MPASSNAAEKKREVHQLAFPGIVTERHRTARGGATVSRPDAGDFLAMLSPANNHINMVSIGEACTRAKFRRKFSNLGGEGGLTWRVGGRDGKRRRGLPNYRCALV